MKRRLLFLALVLCAMRSYAQIPTDGLLMPANTLCTGFMFQQDRWDHYWEGTLKRDNLNIGEFTGNSIMWYGVYGLTPKINLMASLPYVTTKASMGTLMGQKGIQDLMLSGKYKLIDAVAGKGKFTTFAVASFSTPLSDYAPDYFPLALGTSTTNIGGRLTFNYTHDIGVYLNTSGGYTWRSNTFLDRSSYQTNNNYYSTDEVWMPNVLDYKVDLGYHKGPIQAEVSYMQMNTQGGGDIRRQEMPFPSNRMNAQRVGALVMWYVPWPKNVGVRGMVNHTVAGRNVGQATSYMVGVLYTFYFRDSNKGETPKP